MSTRTIRLLSTLLLLCSAVARAAGETRPVVESADAVVAELGKPFELGHGKTAQIAAEGLKLRFAQVTEDSRCPQGVVCVWAGRVQILVEASLGDGKTEELTLSTMDQADGKLPTLDGYGFRLVSILPAAKANAALDAASYLAKIEVTKP